MSGSVAPRAAVVGTGLVGGSIGLCLRARGWHVTGRDLDPDRARRALARGALDAVGDDPAAEVTFVATPVGAAAAEVTRALEAGPGLVTDVGSVKAPIAATVRDPRFVGGHPMAGSEQVGVEGSREDLFEGAVWVLCPDESTPDATYLRLRDIVGSLGAEVVAIPAEQHDALVALVSHVPHLTAATLMGLADERALEHRALLRLAAGGFRDMTRIAAGDPGIWPDICGENRAAIVASLDGLIDELVSVRAEVAAADRGRLLARLERAHQARRNLPLARVVPDELAVLRVVVPDRPGVLSEITTLATTRGINIADIEIAHSGEGQEGVVILVVDQASAGMLGEGLSERGYRVSVAPLD